MTDLKLNLHLTLREAREAFERAYLAAQLALFDGNVSRAAAASGMDRSAFHRKIRELGVHTPGGPGGRAWR